MAVLRESRGVSGNGLGAAAVLFFSEWESCEPPRYGEASTKGEEGERQKGGHCRYELLACLPLLLCEIIHSFDSRTAWRLTHAAKRGRLNAGRNRQSRPRYVSLMNITYDFHGALSRVGTLPADVKAGKEPPADYSGESTVASLSLLPSLPSLRRSCIRYLTGIARYQ